jgi:phosphopantothenoylcysteine decarboxylase/phosphopantothenate--cysteine ligase
MEPDDGALTSGDHGKGRFPTTERILDSFIAVIPPQDLSGKRVLVTAGGTREPIDPVRYIGNHSSGKQGIALAEAAASRGAEVTLILANSERPLHPSIRTISVKTASEMLTHLENEFPETDFLFMAAAIADARPAHVSDSKIKKASYRTIEMTENPDLLATVTANKSHQIVVAFAAETQSEAHDVALAKLIAKKADLIYLNDVSGGAIFGADNTSGHILDSTGSIDSYQQISKEKLAGLLIDKALHKLG